jgi:hypothetical protein
MTKDEALRLAWDALEDIGDEWGFTSQRTVPKRKEAIIAIKEALAQPEQEPVAWISAVELMVMRANALAGAKDWRVNVGLVEEEGDVGLYTSPPQRTWVGLTRMELIKCGVLPYGMSYELYEAIEQALKEKNK